MLKRTTSAFTAILLFVVLLLGVLYACTKKDATPTAEEKRKEDAVFNNSIVAGVGNVFYESNLTPGAASQLIMKMEYNGDTLATYGKINASGQVTYITSTVLAKKGTSELLVTELFPEVSKSRMYSIINNTKSNIVVEVNHFSKTRCTISVLDLDWSTGKSKVIKSTLLENGQPVASFSAYRVADGDRVYNCDQPQPSNELDKTVDNHLDYFACGGLAWDSNPTLNAIKNTVMSSIESLKSINQYKDKAAQLDAFKNSYEYMAGLYNAVKDKIAGFKFEKTVLAGLLKQLESLLNKLLEEKVEVLLVPFEQGTDTDFDEVTDTEIKLAFTVVDKSTGLPYTGAPAYVDMALLIPGTNTAVFMQTKASLSSNGMVIFKFDPTTIPNYQDYPNLVAKWAFSSKNWTETATRNITLSFIRPKVVFATGGDVSSSVTFIKGVPQSFKLVNNDGRDLAIYYSDVTLTSSTNAAVSVSKTTSSSSFAIYLSTNATTQQNTTFDVLYKSKKVATINAAVVTDCDPSVSTAPVANGISIGCSSGGFIKFDVPFTASGSGILPYAGSGSCDLSQTCYPVRLYFNQQGTSVWGLAANGYDASLLSGTVNNGVVEVRISKSCIAGKTAAESLVAYYGTYKWRVELMNKCNQRSNVVEY